MVSCTKYEHRSGVPLAQSPFSATGRKHPAQDLALAFNAVYRNFGGSDADHCLVYRFGNEPAYFEWMALKTAWTGDAGYVAELKEKIVSFPQTDNGYLWSWGTSVYWPTGRGAIHYDGLFRYVCAVADLLRWEGSADLLLETDATSVGEDRALDASEGRSVYEKCRLAMAYALCALDGENGLVNITEASVYLADGVTRFDVNGQGELLWNNTGRAGSMPSDYWDNLCFGGKDAYETALFYHALFAMRDIETFRGDSAGAEQYEILAKTVKRRFNETFWDEEKGRYIACVDADGVRWDPGLTFLNLEALAYGLGSEAQAERIFSWIDGKRTVAGDTLTGKDVLSYTGVINRAQGDRVVKKEYRLAPVTNTVRIEDLSRDGESWWFSLEGAIQIGEGNNAAYGKHLENGGYIFFPVYYELAARAAYQGADAVLARARDIAKVYRFNGLDSDVGGWAEGLTGEFPESGIVSRAFVSSLVGLNPSVDALTVAPAIPAGIKTLGIENVRYAGVDFRIEVGRTSLTLTAASLPLAGTVTFIPETGGVYVVRYRTETGPFTETPQTDENGCLTLELTGRGAVSVEIVAQP